MSAQARHLGSGEAGGLRCNFQRPTPNAKRQMPNPVCCGRFAEDRWLFAEPPEPTPEGFKKGSRGLSVSQRYPRKTSDKKTDSEGVAEALNPRGDEQPRVHAHRLPHPPALSPQLNSKKPTLPRTQAIVPGDQGGKPGKVKRGVTTEGGNGGRGKDASLRFNRRASEALPTPTSDPPASGRCGVTAFRP